MVALAVDESLAETADKKMLRVIAKYPSVRIVNST
jgi:hypothetical protein